jgi:hypothetical protein
VQLAYIVSAYKLPDQLARLVMSLDTPDSHFFIHVDRKADDRVYRQMVSSLADVPTAHLLQRHRSDYGGFGHVRATLKGVSEIIRRRLEFDYAILLTGQDYPIRSNAEIRRFLASQAGKSFMEHFPLPARYWQGGGLDRIESWHVRFRGRRLRLRPCPRLRLARRFPPALRPFGGSAYWCLSRACVEYVHEFVRAHSSYIRFFRFVDVPDELFFQTILLNSPLGATIVNDDLRYVEWPTQAAAGGPAILGKDDFERIVQSSKLFARKFDVTLDAEILDLVDASRSTDSRNIREFT